MKTSVKVFLLMALVAIFMSFTFSTTGYKPGDSAQGFKLKNVDGKFVSTDDYKGAKGFIVVFTCNHCPYAKANEQRIMNLDKKYASKGYPVLAINPNDALDYPEDSFENMAKRSKEKNYTFPYLLDDTQEVAKRFGALKTPHVYLLKKAGKDLKVVYVGAIDDNTEDEEQVKTRYVENAINEIESGKAVSVKETKAIGCGIKWKK
jgi:peroxiredoxin